MDILKYDLELERAAQAIKDAGAKTVCIQLPDGLKQHANKIADELHNQTGAMIIIWLGSCYGACDVPLGVERMGVELLIQWGHSEFR